MPPRRPAARSLLEQTALLAQLKRCSSLRDLRHLLEGLAAAGELRRLASSLPAQRLAAVAAVVGEPAAAAALGVTGVGAGGAAPAAPAAAAAAAVPPPAVDGTGSAGDAALPVPGAPSHRASLAAAASGAGTGTPGAAGPAPSRFFGVQATGKVWMAHAYVSVDGQMRISSKLEADTQRLVLHASWEYGLGVGVQHDCQPPHA